MGERSPAAGWDRAERLAENYGGQYRSLGATERLELVSRFRDETALPWDTAWYMLSGAPDSVDPPADPRGVQINVSRILGLTDTEGPAKKQMRPVKVPSAREALIAQFAERYASAGYGGRGRVAAEFASAVGTMSRQSARVLLNRTTQVQAARFSAGAVIS